MPRNIVEDTEKLQKLKNTAVACLTGAATPVQMDLFLDELKTMKTAYDLEELTGPSKTAYEELLETLRAPEAETELHKEIKKRAMNAFSNMAGKLDSDAAFDAGYYSDLYELVSNEDRIKAERTGYVQKKWAEDQCNQDLRKAIEAYDQEALDQAKRDREENGYTEVRNQLREEGFEKGKLFQSCTEVLKYLAENRKKADKTEYERDKLARIEDLRNSHLFVPYMKVVYDINKDKDKILYDDKNMQEALEQSKKAAEQAKRAEKEEKTADFIKHRDEHVTDVMKQFRDFEVLKVRLRVLDTGKKSDLFDQMLGQIKKFDDAKKRGGWDNQESYKKDCLYENRYVHYRNQFKDIMPKLDDYIHNQQRRFFRGRLGKQRLEAAQQMRDLLEQMSEGMKSFKDYRDAHKVELIAVMEDMDLNAKAVKTTNVLHKLYKEPEAPAMQPALQPAARQDVPGVKKMVAPRTFQKATFRLDKLYKPMEKEDRKPAAPSRKRSNSISYFPAHHAKRARSKSVVLQSPGLKKTEWKHADQKKLEAHKTASVKKKTAPVSRKSGVKKAGVAKSGAAKRSVTKRSAAKSGAAKSSAEKNSAEKHSVSKNLSAETGTRQPSSYSSGFSISHGPAIEYTKNGSLNVVERQTEVKAEKPVPNKKVRERTSFAKLCKEMELPEGAGQRRFREAEDYEMRKRSRLQLDPPVMKK